MKLRRPNYIKLDLFFLQNVHAKMDSGKKNLLWEASFSLFLWVAFFRGCDCVSEFIYFHMSQFTNVMTNDKKLLQKLSIFNALYSQKSEVRFHFAGLEIKMAKMCRFFSLFRQVQIYKKIHFGKKFAKNGLSSPQQ